MARRTRKPDESVDESFSAKIEPLRAYLQRVGAEELNFRRFIVRDFIKGNYYVERSMIRIMPDLSIKCTNEAHAPTKEEATAIATALASAKFPHSVLAPIRMAREHAETFKGDPYFFASRREEGKVVMLRERIINDDGNKSHIPWTYWSDGRWRRMEPDGLLPFWKPLTRRDIPRKMVHEGEKVAAFVDDLVNNPEKADALAAHPWGEELQSYEHWGLIGGALAPGRADYSELKIEQPIEVIYVCDHDHPGQSALQEVSRYYGEALKGIKFGNAFPEAWDMADPMPAELFVGKRKLYMGPKLLTLASPATMATEKVPNPSGKGAPLIRLTRAFKEEWQHCVRPEVFIHRDWPHDMFTPSEFNNKVRPYSHTRDTADLLKTDDASKAAIIKYDPSLPPGIYGGDDGGNFINTHKPSEILPGPGDVGPFIEFMEKLIPDFADRLELMRWCATLVARPSVKMTYGVLLISETQGVGKSTLGEKILTPLLGKLNVSVPSEQDITASQFNHWLAHKRLAVVHEIYAGNTSKAYNALKSVITDRYVTINRKHLAPYELENWMHVYACSNSPRAIRLSMEDRRWLVPRVTDLKSTTTYWTDFNNWLVNEGGLSIIRQWADDFLDENAPVVSGADSPMTEAKKTVVEDGYSQGQILVRDTLDTVRSILASADPDDEATRERWRKEGMLVNGNSVVILDNDFRTLIQNVVYEGRMVDHLEKQLTIRKIARSAGWHVGKDKVSTGMKTWGAAARNAHVITNDPHLADKSPSALGGANSEISIKPLKLDFMKEM